MFNKKKTKKKPGAAKKKIIKKKKCCLCQEKREMFNYKETERLEAFLSEKGRILPQKFSGLCARHQRGIAKVIKRARHAGLMAFEVN